MPSHVPVLFVNSPWAAIDAPSLQLGLVSAAAVRAGYDCETLDLNVEWYRFLAARSLARPPEEHDLLGVNPLGRWIFALSPLFDEPHVRAQMERVAGATGLSDERFAYGRALRDAAMAWVDAATESLLAREPRVVGFSATFHRLAALVISERLKRARPGVHVVFGGTYMAGEMGQALVTQFPWVDVVVRGDAEPVIGPLLEDLLADRTPRELPGLIVREGDRVRATPEQPRMREQLEARPTPSFDDYFARIAGTDVRASRNLVLPIEASRGCYAYQNRCKFCGVSEMALSYGTRRPDELADELREMSARYGSLDFLFVDPTAPQPVLIKALSQLRSEGLDLGFWCQTRPNLSKRALQQLAELGVNTLYLGIESLHSEVLALMRKASTALQGIRTLKWAAEAQVNVSWKVIMGFPGESAEHYEQMTALVPSLTHLPAPTHMGPLLICRGAVYFDQAADYGIEIGAPDPMHPMTHLALARGGEEAARELTYAFPARWDIVDSEAIAPFVEALRGWQEAATTGEAQLSYRRGAGFLEIIDTRGDEHRAIVLRAPHDRLYLAADAGASAARALELAEVNDALDEAAVRRLFDDWVAQRLMLVEDDLYLSLAVRCDRPNNGPARAATWQMKPRRAKG